MPAFSATAPGKIILFGEHAVVYGEPAIAVPVFSNQVRVVVTAQVKKKSGEIQIEAPDISLSTTFEKLEIDHPLRAALKVVLGDKDPTETPACRIQISSEIPVSSGLGSSAAISAAIIRAFSAFLGQRLTDEKISDFAYEVEKIHHGTPSGIDNTVIAHQKPVYYQKGNPFQFLTIGKPFSILIANSGKPGHTREAVKHVQDGWLNDPDKYNQIFSRIGEISNNARELIEEGQPDKLGELMDQNHELLQALDVSSPELDQMVQTAKEAGALGAKLSGGGMGGHMIALVKDDAERIAEKLLLSGATSTGITTVKNRN